MLCTCVQGGKKTRCRKNTMLEFIAGSAGMMTVQIGIQVKVFSRHQRMVSFFAITFEKNTRKKGKSMVT